MISLFAGAERNAERDRLGDPLQVLSDHIDFAALARAVDAKLVIGDRGRGGWPPYLTELMIRLLVLQQLYNLSDEALEYQVLDRSSFFSDLSAWSTAGACPMPRRCGCGASG
ncbi:MAG TPA: transposase [Dokdonella sp.]|nr:transposase [Dokdonella sp.]HUD43193.1 transposase [Dokdonella sp.]